jgi:hypothetical protein
MKYLIALLSALSLFAASAPQSEAAYEIEGEKAAIGEAKRGEKFFELYGGDANARYSEYLKTVKRLESEYYGRVRSAKEAFYKRMHEL